MIDFFQVYLKTAKEWILSDLFVLEVTSLQINIIENNSNVGNLFSLLRSYTESLKLSNNSNIYNNLKKYILNVVVCSSNMLLHSRQIGK